MPKSENRPQPAEKPTEQPETEETLEERDARELAELGPELKAILDETWEDHLPALRYLADR
jgi:hypothetical protein